MRSDAIADETANWCNSGGGSEGDDLQSRLASSNGALQSLLRRLSHGMEDLMPNGHGRARMKVMLRLRKPGPMTCKIPGQ